MKLISKIWSVATIFGIGWIIGGVWASDEMCTDQEWYDYWKNKYHKKEEPETENEG